VLIPERVFDLVAEGSAERGAPTDIAAVVDRLEPDVRTLRKLVAS
jgi:hypothetical protein